MPLKNQSVAGNTTGRTFGDFVGNSNGEPAYQMRTQDGRIESVPHSHVVSRWSQGYGFANQREQGRFQDKWNQAWQAKGGYAYNPNGEGTYKIMSPDGRFQDIPYSNVRAALTHPDRRFASAEEEQRFADDQNYAQHDHRRAALQKQRMIGAGKGALDTALIIPRLANDYLPRSLKPEAHGMDMEMWNKRATPTNPAQALGFLEEQIYETLLPGSQEAVAAKISKMAEAGKNAANIRRAAKILVPAFTSGLENQGRGEGFWEGALTGATGGALGVAAPKLRLWGQNGAARAAKGMSEMWEPADKIAGSEFFKSSLGPYLWMNNGAQKLRAAGESQETINRLLSTAQGQQVLMDVNDVDPGSPRMQSIQRSIRMADPTDGVSSNALSPR